MNRVMRENDPTAWTHTAILQPVKLEGKI